MFCLNSFVHLKPFIISADMVKVLFYIIIFFNELYANFFILKLLRKPINKCGT